MDQNETSQALQQKDTQIKVLQRRLQGAENEFVRIVDKYEKQVAWSKFLQDHRDRLIRFLKDLDHGGHRSTCPNATTESEPCSCGRDDTIAGETGEYRGTP